MNTVININNINSNLLYIQFSGLKFLVDTGSTKSLINSMLFNQLQEFAIKIPFKIKTAHGLTSHSDAVHTTIPDIFNTSMKHTFYKFDFSHRFDGLIGIDLLEKLGAEIDISNRLMTTKYGTIVLQSNARRYQFPPLQATQFKIPVSVEEGEVYVPSFEPTPGLVVRESLARAKNNEVSIIAFNYNQVAKSVNFHDIYEADRITDVEEIFYFDNYPTIRHDNFKQLQLQNIHDNLNLKGMSIEEETVIKSLVNQYKDIFHIEGQKLTFTHCIKHKLNLKNDTPVYVRMYRQPQETKDEIKIQVKDLLDQDIIQDSISPWSCPVNIVTRTSNGKVKKRMVIDYRRLNDQTIEDKYPIPNISDILDKLGRCHYFSSIDLASGYHQVEMDPADVQKTAFSTEQGHFEFKRMPFGLRNAPATFQRLMDNILKGLLEDTCMVYLDDIIVYSVSLQEHLEKLVKVFDRLKNANFKVKLEKCDFLKKELKYLGHLITENGVKPNPEKIDAIIRYPIPKSAKEIKAFLGLVGYYRKFIRDFAGITKPLTQCLKKGAKIEINKDFIDAFEKCKTLLVNEPILQYPDFRKEFIITTDASNVAIGAVLSQGKVFEDRPCQYASRTLTSTEQRYSTIEKELLSIVYAVKTFRPYIYGRHFKIYTDHRPLVWLWKLKEPNSKLLRWKLRLEEYDFEVIYKKGKYNSNADALSRITLGDLNAIEDDNFSTCSNRDSEMDKRLDEIIRDLETMSDTSEVDAIPGPSRNSEDRLRYGIASEEEMEVALPDERPIDSANTVHSTQTVEPTKGIQISETPINNKKIQFFISSNPNIYEVNTERENGNKIIKVKIPNENNENYIVSLIKEYMSGRNNHYLYFESEKLYKNFCTVYIKHFNDNGPKIIRCTQKVTVIDDINDQLELINTHHTGKTNHRGIDETVAYLRRRYFWQKMKETVTNFIKSCEICNKSKYDRHPSKPPLQLTKTPDKPFRKLFIDTFTIGAVKFLTIVDAFSRLGQAIPLSSANSIDVADALLEYFQFYGVPEEINCDSGKEFKNDIICKFLEAHKILVHFGTPMNPPSQGTIERFHSSLIEHIRCLQEHRKDPIKILMKTAIIAYNNSISKTTGFTPFEIAYGHTALRDPMELLYSKDYYHQYIEDHKDRLKHLYESIKSKNEIQKESYVEKSKEKVNIKPFQVGELVYVRNNVRNKLANPYSGPFTILKINNDETVIVKTKTNEKRIHTRRLKHSIVSESSDTASIQSEAI